MRVSRAIGSRAAVSIVVLAIVVAGSSYATLRNGPLASDAHLLRIATPGLHHSSDASAATVTPINNPAPADESRFGGAVEGLGDVDADGVADFAISAYGVDKVYLISGANRTVIREINDPDNLTGKAFGFALADIGDVNGDGANDLAVGAPGSDAQDLPVPCGGMLPPCPPADPDDGRAFLFSGATGALLQRMPPLGSDGAQKFGYSLAPLGDVTGDNVPDIAVGDPRANIRFGHVVAFSGADGNRLWHAEQQVLSEEYRRFGQTMATLDDLNGDGKRELLVGAPFGGVNFNGRALVLSGTDGTVFRTHELAPVQRDALFGFGLANVGDQDDDGLDEYVIGEPRQGSLHLFRGSDGMLIRSFNVNPAPDTTSFFGLWTANVGDKDGDGLDDFWVSAPRSSTIYLLNQQGIILDQTVDPTPPATVDEGGFAWRLAVTADVGGDCGLDLLVGEYAEPEDDGSGGTLTNAGTAYIVTLAQAGMPPVINTFTPLVAASGASVTITGTGFTAATSVTFGGVSTAFIVDSDTQITATVPAGFVVGKIRITAGGCTGTSAHNFHAVTDGALLDPTFNGTGKQTTDFFGSTELANALEIQPDGKIVVAGGAFTGTNCVEFAVARYLPNGSLDGSFGTLGRVTTDFNGGCDTAYALAIQTDGKIVVAGNTQAGAAANDFALARYNTNGSLDDGTMSDSTAGDSFGTGGKVITGFNLASSDDTAYAIALQSDGKIVLAGTARQQDYALARYNADGSLDTNADADPATHFDTDGKLTTSFSATGNEFARAVAVQTDGKIVAAGYSVALGNITLARYNPNGGLDDGTISDTTPGDLFGSFGRVITDFGATDQAYAMVVRPNGKIIVGGSSAATGTNANFALARYNADGSPDTTFNNGTGQRTDDFFGFHDRVYGLAVQTNGKIVAAGYASTDVTNGSDPDQSDFAVARYNPDGSLDNAFDTDGKVTTAFSSVRDEAFAVAVQTDGKIVAAGIAKSADPPVGSGYDFAVARYLGDVVPAGEIQFGDATYSAGESGGIATITVTRADSGPGLVSFSTSDGTATAGQDYDAAAGMLSFAPGETSKTFAVTITDDNFSEGNETINLALGSPGSASLGILSTAVLTIVDNASDCSTITQNDDATVTFACVSSVGTTTFTPIDPSAAGTPPNGFTFCSTCPAFDITTTAVYSPPVTVCLAVPASIDQPTFLTLRLLHGEDGVLVDRTTERFTDAEGQRWVCGNVQSLSPFALAQPQTPTVANGTISGRIIDIDGNPVEGAGVRMNGTQNRLTVTDAQGNYRFDNVETNGIYTVAPSRSNYTFSPSQRSFSQLGQHTAATFEAALSGERINPLDRTEYFVRQQYVDFLSREPDEAGFNFWGNNIEACGADAGCRAVKRTDTSAAFFLSIEFQNSGYLVYRIYQSAYGRMQGAPVPVTRSEFMPDMQQIGRGVVVNQMGWEELLENNKEAFAAEFVQRSRFTQTFPATMTPEQFIDQLFANAGVMPTATDRAAAVNEFGFAINTGDPAARGRALLRVAENSLLRQQEFNQAFVLMQYFGYLRRNPPDAPEPNLNFDGYQFWLRKLNQFNGNFRDAEMVKAFLTSGEYRARFPR